MTSQNNQEKLVQLVAQYQQALTKQPNSAELHYKLATALHQLGEWQAAILGYRRSLAMNSQEAKAHFQLAIVYHEQGQIESAIASYTQAIKENPNYVAAYSNLGSLLAQQKKFQAAIKIYKEAIEIDPLWATLYNNLGQVYLNQEKYDQALSSFKRAIELEPKMVLAHHNLGRLWEQQKNYPAATRYYEQVITLSPNNVTAYTNCGRMLMAQGKIEAAMNYFREAIKLQPDFVSAYCQRAHLLVETDLLDHAKVACAQFLEALVQGWEFEKTSYYLWQTYYYLGEILFLYGSMPKAQLYYQKALELKPDQVEIYLSLGNCLFKQGLLEAAIVIYHQGLVFNPDYPNLLFQLGNTLAKQQRLEQAIPYYQKVLALQLLGININVSELLGTNPFDNQNLILPQGIYQQTKDWIKVTNLGYYLEIDWGKPASQTTENIEQAQILPPGPVKENPQCGGVTCPSCMSKLCQSFEAVQLGNGVYYCSRQEDLAIQQPPVFLATIPNGKAWIAPKQNSWMVCSEIAIITPDNYLLGDLSRSYPWQLPNCEFHDPRTHRLFSADNLPPLEKIDGRIAILSSLSAHVYYHWLIDVLPRFGILQKAGIDWNQIDGFVINSIDQPFQQETLKILGIPRDKIIESDRHPYIQAQHLILPSFPGHLDWPLIGTFNFLRENFGSIPTRGKNYPERIYITRGKAKYRQVLNEEEVINLLNQFGFVTLVMENLSVTEQIAIFENAKVIITSHGSALTNLVFSPPETQIIELFSPHYMRSDYWIFSQQLKLKHYYLKGEIFDCHPIRQLMYQNSLTEDILVNINSLKSALKVVGIE